MKLEEILRDIDIDMEYTEKNIDDILSLRDVIQSRIKKLENEI